MFVIKIVFEIKIELKKIFKFRQKNFHIIIYLNGNFFYAQFTYVLLRSQSAEVHKFLNRDLKNNNNYL